MKKVFMISRAFPPFLPVGHSIRIIKFIKFLPSLGWMPSVLTIDDRKEYEGTRKLGSDSLLSDISNKVKIYRTKAGEISVQYLEKEEMLARKNRFFGLIIKFFKKGRYWIFRHFLVPDIFILWLPYALRSGIKIVNRENIDIIFSTCPPYSAHLIGALIKYFTHKRLIVEYRDDWIGTPWFNSKSKIRQVIESHLEKWVVKMADKVIVVTEWSQRAFCERYPNQPSGKFVLIPNGCELEDFEHINFTKKNVGDKRFTILHAGSLNESKVWGRSASGLFEAVHNICIEKPELGERIRIVFAGDLPVGHQQMAKKLGISSLIDGLGHMSHREVLNLMSSADLLLAINYEGWSTIIPGKIYEYWAVGGPPILLLSSVGAATEFIEKYQLGFWALPSDVKGIKKIILDVLERSKTPTPYQVSTEGIRAFDRQELTKKLANVLSSVIDT